VERAIRPIALGRKNSLFAGSDGGARHWAIVASLVATAKLNGVEPLAWLTDVLERMVSGRAKAHELERLLPWNGFVARISRADALNPILVRGHAMRTYSGRPSSSMRFRTSAAMATSVA
jgi:hypothetical protein